jgi:hypothetical protein
MVGFKLILELTASSFIDRNCSFQQIYKGSGSASKEKLMS